VDVTETIVVYFQGAWNGLYRTIPVQYETPQLMNYSLRVNMQSITNESGEALRYETSRVGHYLKFKIYVPDAEDATHTVVLHYLVSNALRFFEDHDELFWNVTGDEWDLPVGNAQAVVTLPTDVTGVRAVAYTGAYGSRAQDATVEIEGSMVTVAMKRPLAFHEGLTVVVGWDKGFVHQPTGPEKVADFWRSNWPLLIPFLALFLMAWIWSKRGRNPRRNPIAVQYGPPDELTPGEVGVLVDSSARMRDITATLVDLAVRGYLVIEEKDSSSMLGLHHKDYIFHLKKPASEWSSLKPHEQELLAGVFGDGAAANQSVELNQLHNHFYTEVPGIRNSLLNGLVEHGYFLHRPDYVRGAWIGIAFVVGFLLIIGGVVGGSKYGLEPLPFIIAGAVTGLIIFLFAGHMAPHTTEGMRALEAALGFEDFLQHVESDQITRVEKTPALFEKFLPFAMALGVEKKWCGAFQGIFTQPPSWYQGGAYGPNFYPLLFVNNLNFMSAQTASVMSSAPRSSGGSGFGGGGFSGGGFGGGGGGGF
jgi:uncharacterized protein (TIGR04222 family)